MKSKPSIPNHRQVLPTFRNLHGKSRFIFLLLLPIALIGASIFFLSEKNSKDMMNLEKQETYLRQKVRFEKLGLFLTLAESSLRGFAATGNEAFREDLEPAIGLTKKMVDDIRSESDDELLTSAGSDSLEALVNRRIDIMRTLDSLNKTDRTAAIAFLNSGAGNQTADSINKMARRVISESKNKLGIYQDGVRVERISQSRVFYFIIGLSVALIVLAFYFLIRENERRKKIAQQLNLQSEEFRTILYSLTEGLITIDISGRVVFSNPAATELTGWSHSEMKGKPLEKVFCVYNETSGASLKSVGRRILETSASVPMENNTLLVSKQGRKSIISNGGSPLLDANGKVAGAVLVFTDITGKIAQAKQALQNEEKFKQSEKNLRQVLESYADSFYVIDTDFRITLINKIAEKNLTATWGRSVSIGTSLLELIPQNDISTRESLRKVLRGETVEYEQQVRGETETTWLQTTLSPVRDERSNIVGAYIITKDITARKQSEEELRVSEEKYRLLFEDNPMPLWMISLEDYRFIDVNEASVKHYGFSKDEFRKMTAVDIRPKEDQEKVRNILTTKNHGIRHSGQWRHYKKDKSIIDVDIVSHDTKFNGEDVRLVMVNDITEKLKAEKELRETLSQVEYIYNVLDDCFWGSDIINGRTTYISPASEKVFGRSQQDFLDNPGLWSDIVIDEDRPRFRELNYLLNRGKTANIEFRIKCADGSTKWLETKITPTLDESEQLVRLDGITTDISSRKMAEERTKESLQRFEMVAKATSDTIWDWDILSNKVNYNHGIWDMFGYDLTQVDNYPEWWRKNLHPEDRQSVEDALKNAFDQGIKTLHLAYRYGCRDGSYKHILDRAFIIYDEQGNAKRMIGAMQDVTHQKREQARINKAIIDIQEKERQLIGMELHDNVNQLLGASTLYLDMARNLRDEEVRFGQTMDTAKGHILEAVKEIRKISHQLAPASFESVSFKNVIESLIQSVNADGRFKVKLDIEDLQASGDIRINLYRILQEQLNNILKHADASSVSVELKSRNKLVRLSISDDGKGFDPKKTRGGIGLENIRRRVKMHNGIETLISSPGKGCKLSVELPIQH